MPTDHDTKKKHAAFEPGSQLQPMRIRGDARYACFFRQTLRPPDKLFGRHDLSGQQTRSIRTATRVLAYHVDGNLVVLVRFDDNKKQEKEEAPNSVYVSPPPL
jgi:hypothetical protein